MNPFLELPIVIASVMTRGFFKAPKLTEMKVQGRILPGEIVAHHPDMKGRTVLIMRNGYKLTTTLSCDNIDYARQNYDTMLRKNAGRTENIVITEPKKQPEPVKHVQGTIPGPKVIKASQ